VRRGRPEQRGEKPVVIEAIQYDGHNGDEVVDFVDPIAFIGAGGRMVIKTLEGEMAISAGDYVIKGVNGEFYPCKPDIGGAGR
jgi:hypothetical protein